MSKKPPHESNADASQRKLTDADIMREKQNKAEMKRQGIEPEDTKTVKKFDDSYLK